MNLKAPPGPSIVMPGLTGHPWIPVCTGMTNRLSVTV